MGFNRNMSCETYFIYCEPVFALYKHDLNFNLINRNGSFWSFLLNYLEQWGANVSTKEPHNIFFRNNI